MIQRIDNLLHENHFVWAEKNLHPSIDEPEIQFTKYYPEIL